MAAVLWEEVKEVMPTKAFFLKSHFVKPEKLKSKLSMAGQPVETRAESAKDNPPDTLIMSILFNREQPVKISFPSNDTVDNREEPVMLVKDRLLKEAQPLKQLFFKETE